MSFENINSQFASANADPISGFIVAGISRPRLSLDSEVVHSVLTSRRNGPPQVGDIVRCSIKKPLHGEKYPHAFLANFGSATGMLRTRDLHGTEAEQIERADILGGGDDILAMVTRVDLKSTPARFDLSEKRAMAVAHAHALRGTTVKARIVEVTRFGAYVDAGDGISGELNINELAAHDQRKRHQGLKAGQSVTVTILGVQSDARNPLIASITFSEMEAALQKVAADAGITITTQVLGPCNAGFRLLLNDGVEAILPTENLGGTAEASLKKGNNLKVNVVGVQGRCLLVTRVGIGGINTRALQDQKKAARRENDADLRRKMQGTGGGGGSNKGGKGKK